MSDSKSVIKVIPSGSGSEKLITSPIEEVKSIEIPIIPPREHVVGEVTIETVRIRKPVQINHISVRMVDSGGFMITMPGGKVSYTGGVQEIYVSTIEDVCQLIANSLGQTTYEYTEEEKEEWENRLNE